MDTHSIRVTLKVSIRAFVLTIALLSMTVVVRADTLPMNIVGLWQAEVVYIPDEASISFGQMIAIDADDRVFIAFTNVKTGDLILARQEGNEWRYETVDNTMDAGFDIDLAIDSNGRPHIAYRDDTNEDLKYAYWDGAAWHKQTVDMTGDVGNDLSIALDSDNDPHISYFAYNDARLKYAWRDGNTWNNEVVIDTGDIGRYTSIAIDSNDDPHISFRDHTNGDLEYAHKSNGNWDFDTVEWQGDVGRHTSIALDAGDIPHIAYLDSSDDTVHYAKWDDSAGDWTVEEVVGPAATPTLVLDKDGVPHIATGGRYLNRQTNSWRLLIFERGADYPYTTLALDSTGRPHVSGIEFPDSQLSLVYRHVTQERKWLLNTLDKPDGHSTGQGTSIAVGQDGVKHISYIDSVTEELRYIYSTNNPVPSTVDVNVSSFSQGPSLDVDAAGVVHISYMNVEGSVRYARLHNGTKQLMIIDDPAEDSKEYFSASSLKVDAVGRPHVVYKETQQGQLRYAVLRDGQWKIEPIDTAGLKVSDFSFDLDGAGRPHIVYQEYDDNFLFYTYFDGTAWQTEPVGNGIRGNNPSLVLDKAWRTHIAYFDRKDRLDNGDLRYGYRESGDWVFETVDSGPFMGIVMTLDGADRPHIAYANSLFDYLMYASRNDVLWRTEVVDDGYYTRPESATLGRTGEHISIAIDPSYILHITYHASEYGSLQYAYIPYDTGWISVTKNITGEGYPAGSAFTICLSGGPVGMAEDCKRIIGNNGTAEWKVISGAGYVISEQDAGSNWDEPPNQTGLSVTTGAVTEVTITNIYTPDIEDTRQVYLPISIDSRP